MTPGGIGMPHEGISHNGVPANRSKEHPEHVGGSFDAERSAKVMQLIEKAKQERDDRKSSRSRRSKSTRMGPPVRRIGLLIGFFRIITARIGRFLQKRRFVASRRWLLDADDRTLADLGISRAQAAFEVTRRPWEKN